MMPAVGAPALMPCFHFRPCLVEAARRKMHREKRRLIAIQKSGITAAEGCKSVEIDAIAPMIQQGV
jgi:hypothetical protein